MAVQVEGQEVTITTEVYEAIRQYVEWATKKHLEEMKEAGKPLPSSEDAELFKRALYESEVESYPVIYVMKSQWLQRKIDELSNR